MMREVARVLKVIFNGKERDLRNCRVLCMWSNQRLIRRSVCTTGELLSMQCVNKHRKLVLI